MSRWPMVPLGEVLRKSDDWVIIHPEQRYKEVTVRLWGNGVVLRREVAGAEIASPTRLIAHAGQFIISRIDARNGASGLVPEALEGAVVSNDFPVFTPDLEKSCPPYLGWLSKTKDFVELCKGASEGTTNRVRLKEERFLSTGIPLPPLDEQRRLVERIEAVAAKVAEAKRLKEQTRDECARFWKVLSRMARGSTAPPRRLAEMVEFLDGQRVPLSEAERATRKGPYPYYGASGIIDHVDDYLFDEELLLLSEDGANLINRSTPIAFIARGRYWVNNHAHVLKPKAGVADIRFLEHALADYDVSVFNFASAQAKLNQKNARQIAFPLPPLDEQRRIAGYLDELRQQVEPINKLQQESARELDAMLPAVLDRAFKGEL